MRAHVRRDAWKYYRGELHHSVTLRFLASYLVLTRLHVASHLSRCPVASKERVNIARLIDGRSGSRGCSRDPACIFTASLVGKRRGTFRFLRFAPPRRVLSCIILKHRKYVVFSLPLILFLSLDYYQNHQLLLRYLLGYKII